jgi:hypothetical protein
MHRTKWARMRRRRTASWTVSPPSYRSAWRSTLEGHFQSSSAMSWSQMMPSAPTRNPRRGRLWLLHPVVLLWSTRWCTTMAPPIHLGPSTSISVCSSSGLPARLSASTSGQHLRLYLHLHLWCACLHHPPLELPPATPASTMVAQAISLGSAPRRRRLPHRATSSLHHVVRRGWPSPRLVASTTPPWKIFLRASKSSRVRFL